MGSTKRPFYRIVVAESTMPRDGRFVEIVGHYNPITDPAEIHVEEDKVYHWLRQGALPSDTVRSLLRDVGVWRKWSLLKKGVDPEKVKEMVADSPVSPVEVSPPKTEPVEEPVPETETQPEVVPENEDASETKA